MSSRVAVPKLRRELFRALTPVATVVPQDRKWFYVKSDGSLNTYHQPTGFWKWWECVHRWLVNIIWEDKYRTLQQRIRELTYQVETYLQHEDNMSSLNEFLLKFTPILNQLFDASFKIAQPRLWKPIQLDAPVFEQVRRFIYIPKIKGQPLEQKFGLEVWSITTPAQVVLLVDGERKLNYAVSETILTLSQIPYYQEATIQVSQQIQSPRTSDKSSVAHPTYTIPLKMGYKHARYRCILFESKPPEIESFAVFETRIPNQRVEPTQQLLIRYLATGQPVVKNIDSNFRGIAIDNQSKSSLAVCLRIKAILETQTIDVRLPRIKAKTSAVFPYKMLINMALLQQTQGSASICQIASSLAQQPELIFSTTLCELKIES